MTRSAFQQGSLIIGVTFIVLALVFVLDSIEALDADVEWIAPTTLIALGIAMLVATMTSSRRAPQSDAAAVESTATQPDY